MQFVVRSRLDIGECRNRLWRAFGGSDKALPAGIRWYASGSIVGDALAATVIAGEESPYGGLGEVDWARIEGTLAEERGGTVVSGTVRLGFPTTRHKIVLAAMAGVLATGAAYMFMIDPQSIVALITAAAIVGMLVWRFRNVRFGSESQVSAVAVGWLERVIEGKADQMSEAQ